jgi:Resolvase, N terminal domain
VTTPSVVQEYVDIGISGTKEKRPQLDRLMADAHTRKFDVVCVWKFDRFARSVSHLQRALVTFQALGIEFVSLHRRGGHLDPSGENGVHGPGYGGFATPEGIAVDSRGTIYLAAVQAICLQVCEKLNSPMITNSCAAAARRSGGRSATAHCRLAYSAWACFRTGMSGSASFQSVKKSR